MQTIHPLLVHFPVAMISLYAMLEIGSFIPFIKKMNLALTKMILLGVGFGFGALSSLTGEEIEHSFPTMRNLVEMHSAWASITNVIAGILLIVYIGYVIQPWFEKINLPTSIRAFVKNIFMVINWIQRKQWILVIAAIILLGAITITGALGAAIVHGPDVDPVVKYIYTLFVR